MKKEARVFNKEEIIFLDQLAKTIEQTVLKLDETYEKKDYHNFNKLKKFVLAIQKKISEVIK
ncbi:MAG: hypothetical protein ABIA78_01810 [archaeon]